MAKPSSYWDKRAIRRLTDAERQGEKYSKRIQKIYDQAYKNIQRDIDDVYRTYSKATGLDVQSLKTLLTKSETDKLWKELKAKGLDKYIKGNYKARISRLEKLQAQIYAKAKEIYPKEQLEHTMCYEGVINSSYYKAIYDTQTGTGLDFAFSKIDDNMVEALLRERWSGKNYSQCIWGNTDLLAESLSEIIGGGMISGQSIEKMSREVRERFGVAKYYADRLVRTEVNHFNNEADAMAYEEMDVDKYVFLATLDTRTSTICQNLDHEVIELKDKQVGKNFPPMHPNCRSKTRAYMGEEIEATLKRRARNPITGKTEIIDNISYKEWAKQHGLDVLSEENDGVGLKKQGKSGIITEKPTYKQALAIQTEEKRAKAYAKNVSFKGATNPDNIKTVNDTLDYLTARYPTEQLDHIFIDDLNGANASASAKRMRIDKRFINSKAERYDWSGRVKRNKAQIAELEKQWLKGSPQEREVLGKEIARLERENKFKRLTVSSDGYGVRGTITHEYGHILSDQRIGLSNGSKAISSYDKDKEAVYSKVRDKVSATYKRAIENGDVFKISKYAEKNEREFFSEVFAMREMGEELPEYITGMISEVLNV